MSDGTSNAKMNNVGIITYKYTPDSSRPDITYKECTNTNIIPLDIKTTDIDKIVVKKISGNSSIAIGATTSYAIMFYNAGNVNLNNGIIKDRIDNNTIYISNSMKIRYYKGAIVDTDITLLEYKSMDEANNNDYFNDFVREKAAVYARQSIINTVAAIGITENSKPDWLTDNEEILSLRKAVTDQGVNTFYTTGVTKDKLKISDLNRDYELNKVNSGDETTLVYKGKSILSIYDVAKTVITHSKNTKEITAEINYLYGGDAIWVTKILLAGNWGNNEYYFTPNKIEAVKNIVQVLTFVINKLVDISLNSSSDVKRKSRAAKNVEDLKAFLENIWGTYIESNSGFYDGDGKVKLSETDTTISAIKISESDINSTDISVIENQVIMLEEKIDTCILDGVFIQIPHIKMNVIHMMRVIYNLAINISKEPVYTKDENQVIDYDNPSESRLSKIWDVAKDLLAVSDTILTNLFSEKENKYDPQYSIYVTKINNYKETLKGVIQGTSIHISGQGYDNQGNTVATVAIGLYKVWKELNEIIDISGITVYQYKFMPVTSNGDFMFVTDLEAGNNSMKTYKNPSSPESDVNGSTPSVKVVLENAFKELYRTTSYAIVPDLAKTFEYEKDSEGNPVPINSRDIEIHLNNILEPKGAGVLAMSVKVGGNESNGEDDDEAYSIKNSINIATMNSEKIINKLSMGYSIEKDGQVLPGKDVPPLTESEGTVENKYDSELVEIAETPVKFAYLVASKDVFVKVENGEYVKGEIKCGDDICYLITLKNYGNLEAEEVSLQDLLRTGLEFAGGGPEYITEILPNSVPVWQQIDYYTVTIYDPNKSEPVSIIMDGVEQNSISGNKYIESISADNYITGLNYDKLQTALKIYACDTESVAERARIKGFKSDNGENIEFGIVSKNRYVEIRNLTIPRRKNGANILEVEKNYDYSEPQKDTNNDGKLGVVELRLYYTVKCESILGN